MASTGAVLLPDEPATSAPVKRLALLGNPNTGKTTLFNALCGTRAKTSNFPGTTTAAIASGKLAPQRNAAGKTATSERIRSIWNVIHGLDESDGLIGQ